MVGEDYREAICIILSAFELSHQHGPNHGNTRDATVHEETRSLLTSEFELITQNSLKSVIIFIGSIHTSTSYTISLLITVPLAYKQQ